jgi:thioredoxin reductase (NADPH)
MSDPVLLVVDHDPRELTAFESALRRRYGADYRVLAERSPEAALNLLERLAEEGEDVALVAADLRLPEIDGVEFLERAHALHRGVVRALLVAMDEYHTRIPLKEMETVRHATALGRIDFWVVKGWTTPEEWLYPRVQEALSAWTTANRSRHLVYRVIGERWDPRTHTLRDLLTRNSVPFEFYPAGSGECDRLVGAFGVDTERLPALIRHDGSVLHDPTFSEVAASHGIQTRPSPKLHDLAILGAGPAGLAAAVYGASEGLKTLVLEPRAIGGQAGTSSMIRNYLGFPKGIGGGDLAHRAWEQAVLFGAEFAFTQPATGLATRGKERVIALSDGSEVIARAVIIASGVDYRRIGVPSLEHLVGAGVFYGAAGSEAPAMAGEEVCVVGGANSAAQAALHLAGYASRVNLLVRRGSLASGMSDYLVRQIEATPNIEVRLRTRAVEGHGEVHLEALTIEDAGTGLREDVAASALFVMIGAEPHTEWLGDTIRRDDRGFVLTGRDVPREEWMSDRLPLPFETSMPGVFAAGDVRYGSVKRVAGAVGEGSVAVGSVHRYIGERARVGATRTAK